MAKKSKKQPTIAIPDCALGHLIARSMLPRSLAPGCCEPVVEAFEALRVAESSVEFASNRLAVVLDRVQDLEWQLGIARMQMDKQQLKRFKIATKEMRNG